MREGDGTIGGGDPAGDRTAGPRRGGQGQGGRRRGGEARDPVGATPVLDATSLIFCTRDRPRMIVEAIASVLGGDAVPAEIVVVDQSAAPHPTLPTTVMPAGCTLRYVHTTSRGLSRARNEGVRAARHPILAFTDDDCLADPSWLRTLVGALVAAGTGAAVSGRVLPVLERPDGYVPAVRLDDAPAVYTGRVLRDALVAGNLAIHRTDYEALGGYDERLGAGSRYPASEDNDLGFRLLRSGRRIHFEPAAVVWHRAWRAGDAVVPQRWRYGYGQGAFYAKHVVAGERGALGLAGRRILQLALRMPRRLAGRPRDALGDAAYLLGLAAGGVAWLRNERAGR